MKQLLYVSIASKPINDDEITALLNNARPANLTAGITGMLLYVDGQFMQFLEGEADQVDATYAKIAKDSRHYNIQTISEKSSTVRTFPDWTMGYVMTNMQGVTDIASGVIGIKSLSDLYAIVRSDLMLELMIGLSELASD